MKYICKYTFSRLKVNQTIYSKQFINNISKVFSIIYYQEHKEEFINNKTDQQLICCRIGHTNTKYQSIRRESIIIIIVYKYCKLINNNLI